MTAFVVLFAPPVIFVGDQLVEMYLADGCTNEPITRANAITVCRCMASLQHKPGPPLVPMRQMGRFSLAIANVSNKGPVAL
jgi:hypothetical protein